MKRMKKIVSIMLALVMMFALNATVFAAGNASITISGAVNGETYTAYKLFDVTKSTSGDAYSYFTTSVDLKNALVELGLTFTESADGSEWIVDQTKENGEVVFGKQGATKTMTAAQLAEKINTAMTAEDSTLKKALDSSGSDTAANNTAAISGLDAGYYFVDSSLGSLCALDTTTTEITINEKNSKPSITKKVWEDSSSTYGTNATIDVIDTVKYQLIVNTGNNTNGTGTGVDSDYTIEDVLPEGIAYKDKTIAVAVDDSEWTIGTDYTATYDTTSRKLSIVLKSSKLSDQPQSTDIVITYDATVSTGDNDIKIGTIGNENTATLTYHNQTDTASATVYTYEIGGLNTEGVPYFKKVDGATNKVLVGVTFVLSKTEGNTTTYAQVDKNNYLTAWGDTATELKTDANGSINVKGLDAGTYILTETATLDGYNLLDDTITVKITDEGVVTYWWTSEGENAAGSVITVENNTGSELPTTGGTGTTVLYTIGIILVLGAGILLVVRRRMSVSR